MTRYLVQHVTSGDVFVVEVDEAGMVVAESDALYYADWQEPDTVPARPRADLDLSAFALNALDEPDSDDKYRYLTS